VGGTKGTGKRGCPYYVLVKVYSALHDRAHAQYVRKDGAFTPSGVWIFRGSPCKLIIELGLNSRYWTDAFRELEQVGCIRKLQRQTYQVIRPPLVADWLSLRSDRTLYNYSQRILRASVERYRNELRQRKNPAAGGIGEVFADDETVLEPR
jgi:hypothetical protein